MMSTAYLNAYSKEFMQICNAQHYCQPQPFISWAAVQKITPASAAGTNRG